MVAHPQVAKGVAHLCRCALGKQAAIEHQHPVIGVEVAAPVVAAHQQGEAGIAQLAHHLEQLGAGGGIDGRAGLIEQQQAGRLHQGAGQQGPLLLAA